MLIDAEQGVIEKLIQFLDIDDETREFAHRAWSVLEPTADSVLDEFYQRINRAKFEPHISSLAATRLKGKQKTHWASLFSSNFDEDYMAGVRRIGIQHRDVGLDLSAYIASYMSLKITFTNVIVHTDLPVLTKGRLIQALDKYVAFDMALALSTYDATIVD
jgi:hypothetical protein